MSLETSLRECSAGLSSDRATERKKCAESLKSFLAGNAAPALLSDNTLKRRGFCWNKLFEDVHDYILKEFEKYLTSKTFESQTKPLATSLLHIVVAGANKGKAFIKSENLTNACLQILKNKQMTKAFGDAYLSLLFKCIISVDHYVGYISPQTWEELLDVAILSSDSEHFNLDHLTRLRLVLLIMQNGQSNCQFISSLRNAVPSLQKYFSASNDKKVQEILVEISTVLLTALSTEYRLAMCEFTETILSFILSCYDQNADSKKKAQFFKLITMIVELHHPEGRMQSQVGSLAFNWNGWNRQLNSILELILFEGNFLQKSSDSKFRQKNDPFKDCLNFFNLAAAVYYQIFNIAVKTEVNEGESSSKRQKVTSNKIKSFTDLIEEFRQNPMPWLGIISAFAKRYNYMISKPECFSLLNVIEKHVTSSKEKLCWSMVKDMACIVLIKLLPQKAESLPECDAILASLWNCCVRLSSQLDASHEALHSILQHLIKFNGIGSNTVQPLTKMYLEGAMPVTDHSIQTLSHIQATFFSKYNNNDDKTLCLKWFAEKEINCDDPKAAQDLFLRLIANENIETPQEDNAADDLYDTIFNCAEKCVLFSEFEINLKPSAFTKDATKKYDVNNDLENQASLLLNKKLLDLTEELKKKEVTILQFARYMRVFLAYKDVLLKRTNLPTASVMGDDLYKSMKIAMEILFTKLTELIKNDNDNTELLKCVQIILSTDYNDELGKQVRAHIETDFFYSLHKVVTNDTVNDCDGDVSMENDDSYEGFLDVRHYCIRLLAAYCRVEASYRQDVLHLILDRKLYRFTNAEDIESAFQCMVLLTDPAVEKPPLEAVFSLMQSMCKDLFRNSKATGNLLKILLPIIDKIWALPTPTARDNCCIMIHGYLQRSEKLFFPPYVAALIYKCVATVEKLNRKYGFPSKSNYVETLTSGAKGATHAMRLYCCYLLQDVYGTFSADDVTLLVTQSLDLFMINVAFMNEQMIKDESSNRTLTFLHVFFALAQTKPTLIKPIVFNIVKVQKEKSLNKEIFKKVLEKITLLITTTKCTEYWSQDILSFLYFWFETNTIEDMPLYLFGYDVIDAFLVDHFKWVVPAEVLWCKSGVIQNSDALRKLKNGTDNTEESVLEACFCNIIVLCLPYVVTEKYEIEPPTSEKLSVFNQSLKNAHQFFTKTRDVLGSAKWTNRFVECMGELVLLTATHLADYKDARTTFGVDVPRPRENYYYPKEVFSAILKYFGELIEADIMHYLCEHQPLAISKIALKLWQSVLQKHLIEFKCLSLHTYVIVMETLPLGFPSDPFVCNHACSSILHAIQKTINKNELKMYITALSTLLNRFLPSKAEVLKETLPRAVSLLMIKKQEGFSEECQVLLDFLVSRSDQTDGVNVLSQDMRNTARSCYGEFSETLESFLTSLTCPSFEILCNLRVFLATNKRYVTELWAGLNARGFSEDCDFSLLHRAVNALNRILTEKYDSKTVIEACNCLSSLGTYDMKTLVMSARAPPEAGLRPPQQVVCEAARGAAGLLFDEQPAVVSLVMATLARLLKYRDGKTAMELGIVDEEILRLFLPSSSNYVQAKFQINEAKFNTYKAVDFWRPKDMETHCEWVTRLTTTLLDVLASAANYVATLSAVCKSKPNLCRSILPSLIGLVLFVANENQIKDISAQINHLLDFMWDISFCDSNNDSETVRRKRESVTHDHKMIIQDVLDVVNFVRLQRHHYAKRQEELESFNYLRLDYNKVAWAAATADHSLTALYYGELWAMAKNGAIPPDSPEAMLKLTGGEDMQSIFRKCFISIGELDAIDGCGSGHLTSEDEKRKHLLNTGQHSDALLMHDIALSYDVGTRGDYELQYGVIKSLYESGMHHLALQYIKSLPENEKLDDIKYECLSFLGDWTVFVDTQELEAKSKTEDTNMETVLKTLRYACLKDCLNIQATTHNFDSKLQAPIDAAKMAVSQLSRKLNMDNCQSVYKIVSHLQMFSDIEDYYSVRRDKLSMRDLVEKWRVSQIAPFHDFKHVEPLISQRSLILEHAAKAHRGLQTEIMDLQLRYAELGLSNQKVQLSQRLLAIAKKCHSSPEVALVEGQISWAKGHKEISLSLLRDIIYNKTPDVKLKAAALRQYGTWMAESRCENTRDIIDKYLKKSIEVLGRSDEDSDKSKVYCDIAKYADAEYKQVVSYMKSSVFENKVKCMKTMKGAALSLRSTGTQQALNKDERKALMTNEKLSILDEAEINNTIEEKKRFLELAMRYYLMSLKEGDASDLSVFRVISLWLDNPLFEFELHGDRFKDLLKVVPSRKYVPVLPQLAPRLVTTEDCFATNLNDIMRRCTKDHPYHTLPILFGLKNSDKDKSILNASASVSRRSGSVKAEEGRVAAARALLREAAGSLGEEVGQMGKMCDAIISFANFEMTSKEIRQKVPRSEPLCRLGGLERVPVPTVTLPVRKDCDYSNVPGILSFADTFELVGGINCPKKMTCKSYDGRTHTILIKGQDDLRQDAVMQQVFGIVNTLLDLNPITSRNKLSIRTYKVVALSRRSGVLEWCAGTLPVGSYLVGSSQLPAPGAHQRYRPKDISPNAARSLLTKCHEKGKSNVEKLATFLKILREFRPVFHYFFTEHYLDPVTWFERRLAYTKSVATSSMVGYVLGLGDRHLQNILIDKESAEVIHIDFGIAFDQGKALPTPETIPFRLTQDIIAGFGPSGVEGVFRRCCERTLQLLREHRAALLTALEVLLCDPLYAWTVSPAAAKRKQNLAATPADTTHSSADGGRGLAERALLAVTSKLSGEGGGGVAVAGQVARLLHCATDPAALSRLYPGWQPYL